MKICAYKSQVMEKEVIVLTPEKVREIFREELVLFHKNNPPQVAPQETAKTIFNLDEFCQYCNISRQTGYKLTSSGSVPFARRGKRLYFSKVEIDAWLLQNRGGISEVGQKANEYLTGNRRRRGAK